MSRKQFKSRWTAITSDNLVTDKLEQQVLSLFSDALPPSNSCPSAYEMKKSNVVDCTHSSTDSIHISIKDQLRNILITNYYVIIDYKEKLVSSNDDVIRDFQDGQN